MEKSGIIYLIISSVILLLFFGGIYKYLKYYVKESKFLLIEMSRAKSKRDFMEWKHELWIARLCIIPFVTYNTIDFFYNLFYFGKHSKDEKNNSIVKSLLPSFMGIGICVICLAGQTYAWFSVTQTTSAQTIQAANYNIESSLNGEGLTDKKIYTLDAGEHYLDIKAVGSASTGYCILRFGKTEPYINFQTVQLLVSDETIRFNLQINESTKLELIPQWGISSSKEKKIDNNDSLSYGAADFAASAD